MGATDAQASSGLLILCVTVGLASIGFALVYRIPISIAWSTPGAALLVAAGQNHANFAAAVGAFIVCGALIILCGLWPALGRLMTSIPKAIASAMLAGILFPICLAPVTAMFDYPLLALPIILAWLIILRLAPRWAVPSAMLVAAIVIAVSAGGGWMQKAELAPQLAFVLPVFDPAVIVSLGLPLFIVTMAGQNVPGFVVMSTFGYETPARPVLVGTGVASVGGAIFGGHAINLAAITAAIMASPEADPDKSRRWIATLSAGVLYLLLGLGAGVATALVAASPPILIIAVAGLAVVGALVTSITGALEEPPHRIAAIATFLVTASGLTIAGIGSAFWGLVVGAIFMLWLGWGSRSTAENPEPAP
ncbi:benzoate membrane transport protein [Cryobacterium mesophilum]|nr:benzoate membrane transport protein [Terrimesophilobacter mesophilus]